MEVSSEKFALGAPVRAAQPLCTPVLWAEEVKNLGFCGVFGVVSMFGDSEVSLRGFYY